MLGHRPFAGPPKALLRCTPPFATLTGLSICQPPPTSNHLGLTRVSSQGAGWQGRHRRLVGAFLASAAQVLAPGGEVHLAHKAGPPFDGWDLPALAGEAGLQLLGSEPFPQDLFPTYVNRRGAGKKPAKMFPMHDSVRFRFGRGD